MRRYHFTAHLVDAGGVGHLLCVRFEAGSVDALADEVRDALQTMGRAFPGSFCDWFNVTLLAEEVG